MRTKTNPLLPGLEKLLARTGENIRLARLRRRLTAEMVAERSDLSRPTLLAIESGDPGVSMGAYARVLSALGLEQDLGKLAGDDELGRKLQDIELPTRARAPRRRR